MTDGRPIRPSRERLRALTPSGLLTWAINCLDWARHECDQPGAWTAYDDMGIRSVRGDQGQYTGPVCMDAGANANYIALMGPPIGAILSDVLLRLANELRGFDRWEDVPNDPRFARWTTYAWAMVIINRYYEIIGIPESEAV